MSKPPLLNTTALSPCNHEEADSRMILHAAHTAHNGHKKILIRTVDTDVVALAVALVRTLEEEAEVWVSFGTGKAFRFLEARDCAGSRPCECTGTTDVLFFDGLRHSLLLRWTWQDDSMGSVDSSTSAHPDTHWPIHCTGSY